MIGLELLDARVVAVAVEEDGRVVKRVCVDARPDLAAAAVGAVGTRLPGRVAPVAITSGVAAAVAESWLGAGRGFKDVVFFAVSEHATGGIVRDGSPIDGGHRRAGSVAWLALNPVEREDYRKIGCLEAEVAAAGIVRRLIWRIKSGDNSSVKNAAGGNLSAITVDHVLDAARKGDGVCISVVRDTAKYLGMAAANLIVITDPQVLVLGGLMTTSADLFFEPTRIETSRRLPKPLADVVTIATATLKDDAPAIGAAKLAAVAVR